MVKAVSVPSYPAFQNVGLSSEFDLAVLQNHITSSKPLKCVCVFTFIVVEISLLFIKTLSSSTWHIAGLLISASVFFSPNKALKMTYPER